MLFNSMERQIYLEGLSDGTYSEYYRNLNLMIEYFNGRNLSELSNEEIFNYEVYLKKKYAASTYNNKIASIRYVMKKIIKKENYNQNNYPLSRKPKKQVVTPSEEETGDLLYYASLENYELMCMIAVAVGCGLRISEVVRVKCSDINRNNKTLKVTGKNNVTRFTILPNDVIRLLEIYYIRYRIKSDSDYMFYRDKKNEKRNYIPSDKFGRDLKKLQKRYKLYHYTVHNLRKFFATQLYGTTHNLFYVARALGHSSETTLKTYVNAEKLTLEQKKAPTIYELYVEAKKRATKHD